MSESLSTRDTDECPEQDPTLGKLKYRLDRAPRVAKRRRRSLEVMGVVAGLLVPLSLVYVHGWTGKIVALLSALVALAAYLLSGGRRKRTRKSVCVYEGGLLRLENTQTERVVWNEIIEIDRHDLQPPDSSVVTTIVLEIAARKPWFVVVGGHFSNERHGREFIEALAAAWLPVWRRRCRTLVQEIGPQVIGNVTVSPAGLKTDNGLVSWDSVRGIDDSGDMELLVLKDTKISCDTRGAPCPFPSSARRLSILAMKPPEPPLLLTASNKN